MARARLLKPGFFANEELATLPPYARLLFAGLWTLADREGRLKDVTRWIAGQLFPYEEVDVEELLTQLAKHRFIQRYQARGQRYIQVSSFKKHQSPHIKEADSVIPAPHVRHSVEHGVGPGAEPESGMVLRPSETETEAETDNLIRSLDPVSDPVTADENGVSAPEPEIGAPPESLSESASVSTSTDPFANAKRMALEYRQAQGEYETRLGPLGTSKQPQLALYVRRLGGAWVLAAIKETAEKAGTPGWDFLAAILERCIKTGEPPAIIEKVKAKQGGRR